MKFKIACTILAAMPMLVAPVAVQAADAVIGTVTSSDGAFVARDGHIIPVTPNMPLYEGDRLVTRAGGTAKVAFANQCALRVGASSMVPVTSDACAKNKVVALDKGRASYAGTGSAFQDDNGNDWVPFGVAAALIGVGACVALCGSDHPNFNLPVSP